ncbi:MAG: DUF1993 domain-containing protein [Reyranella sp.]|uniref:DUF1993 domain-containing protein n=1 Tax=Reyranella sp. TaxID=1929291 RepID=UPI001AC927CE|nr:DUF1993 domain-containing protein [Reyranella sp.]MBN9088873.1 DUF1993 domain-containing protein [Reyranella sp.]
MAFGMYAASVPVYQRQLGAISKVLERGSAWAEARKVDEAVLMGTRLIPDMLPFSRQVQIACRFAEESAARLAGAEVPKAPENAEKTLAELRARIAAVLEALKAYKPGQIDGSESREISLTIAGNPIKLTGEQYLTGLALPNFYFHCTTTYAILRQAGVEIGKRDFLGAR